MAASRRADRPDRRSRDGRRAGPGWRPMTAGATASGGSPARARVTAPAVPAAPAIGLRYLGHATVVLDLAGIRVMTDPFLRDRLGPLRRHGPVPQPGAIGPIDVVAI